MKVVGLADRFAPSGCPRIRIGNTNSSWMDIAPLARRWAVVFSCGLATAETSVGASRQSLRHWINCPMRRLSTARSSRWTKTESHRSTFFRIKTETGLISIGFLRGERKIAKIGRFRAKQAEPRVRIHSAPPTSLGYHDSPAKSIKLARLRALRAGEVHRIRAERCLSRRIGRILSIARRGGGLRRFSSGAEVRQRDGFGKQTYPKNSGSGPWAAELTGWFCEAEEFFLRMPT
jgi:hypothetical protein